MKWIKRIDEEIASFEKARGRTLNPQLVVAIKAMAAVGDRFEDLGIKDASSGRVQRTKEAFVEWGERMLNDPEEDNPIVDLMYECYLDGYSAGREQHEG